MIGAIEELLNFPGTTVIGYQLIEGFICLHLKLLSWDSGGFCCLV
ncbi:hypothetical protein MC7420_3129 [Coleofasciculus chthonoplastes PCC 7420]|uniref:Uncharacterized protein n=1 Tax=Coleofasciculus chthonoplastes PCC 7420 TaxID=118168 RepID=B4VKB2_9CYAN|nr:hypothetical protein MC7420_3129 [Coleofasciculus chthonoplastes PCC 7420]